MPKRTRHEGTIYRHKSGRWAGSLELPRDASGKRRRCTVYGSSAAEVRAELSRLQARRSDGLSLDPARETVAEYLTRWLEARRRVVRPGTWIGYERIVRLHLIPALGAVRLSSLEPEHLRRAADRWACRPVTTRTRLRVLSVALADAVKDGAIPRSPAARVRLPKVERAERRTLTPDEAGRLLAAAPGHRFGAAYAAMLLCGLRRGEVLGLCWDAVDLDAGVLQVREALQLMGGEWRLVPPKTPASRRTVALASQLVNLLRLHRARQAEDRLACGSLWRESGLVFCGYRGGPLCFSTFSEAWHAFCADEGLPTGIRLHDLRHSCATLLIEGGEHSRVVQEILGHSSHTITMDLYGHVRPIVQAQAIQRFADRVGTPPA